MIEKQGDYEMKGNRILASLILVATMVLTTAMGMWPQTKAMIGKQALSASNLVSVSYDGSRSLDFDKGWKFILVNPNDITDPSGIYGNATAPLAQAVNFADSSWRSLDLPHDWSIELLPQASGGSVSGGTGYLQGGLGWYRKTFTLPPSMAGKKISIEFDGVYMDSYEYINGTLLGNHPYGYTGFTFDVTNLVYTDGVTPNVLAVVVQNKLPSSRWYSGSGIYRNVHLLVTDPIHVTRWGTYVTTPDLETTIQSGYANVEVQTQVLNESGQDADADIVSKIKDATGAVVAQTTSANLPLGSTVYTDTVDIQVNNPTLWSFENPYLYSLETDVVVGGNVVDTYDTTFGIRYFKIDPNLGFFLNGQHAKLQGVDLHHDQGALGSAINYDALMREMTILKSMGVNSFRTSHNPPAPEMLDVNQRLGIVMMVEAFDCWSSGKTTFDYGRFFNAWSDYDIKEMVNEAKNNPAVIMWSIGNEIPGFTSVSNMPTAQRLIDDIRSIDNTRYVVAGSDQYRSVPSTGSGAEQVLLKLDGMGLNYDPAKAVDGLHAKYPTKFFFESESSSETSSRGVYQDPDAVNTGENYAPGHRGASSYDNNLASWTMSDEYGLKKDRDRQYFAGQFIWSGFDYIGEPTPYGQFPVKVSSFGAIDTAGFPKDGYYVFKSQWTSQPMVHLLPMNWTDYKPGENVEVWAYANVDTVELFLNGVSLGVKTFDHKTSLDGVQYLETTECTGDDKNYTSGTPCIGSYTSPNGSSGKLHLTWDVPFAPGQLVAVAMQDGVEVARDELDTAGPAYTLRLTPDKTVISADGKSLSYITVDVVDSNGVMLPSGNNLINISISGSGTLVGLDNGRQEDAEGYKLPSHTAFNGKLLAIVQSTGTPGLITFTATSSGLLPATITLEASNATGSDLIALAPAYLRVPLGVSPTLPATVVGIHADGSTEELPVTWDSLPAIITTYAGSYTVNGVVSGTNLTAQAAITIFKAAGVQGYSTAVPVGTAPFLPPTVRVVYSDGSDGFLPVTWEPVSPSQYAAAGQFSVNGAVDGIDIPAVASIRVTSAFTSNQNIARSTSPAKPAVDASYAGSNSTLPAAMLDGTTTTGGWSNAFTKAATNVLRGINTGTNPIIRGRATDWVTVSWPEAQTFSTMNAYFTQSSSRRLPQTMTVSYWDSTGFVPVNNLNVTWAGASNQPSIITFSPVATTRIRIDMTSPLPDSNTGFMQITELQVIGNQLAYNATASLTDLQVNGQTVPGFDSGTTTYTIPSVKKWPEIKASTASNGSLLIVPPLTVPGTGTVTVTSEDGSAQKTYSIYIGNVAPQVTSSLASQSVQYTDAILPVSIDAADVAADLPLSATTQWSLDGGAFQPGLPAWLALTPAPCTSDTVWGACSWTLASSGPVPVQAGTYRVKTTVSDGTDTNETEVSLKVTPEDAYLEYSGEAIAQIGSKLSLHATAWDSAASGYPGANPETGLDATTGDVTKMWVAFDLYPDQSCLSGTPTTLYAQVADTGTAEDGIGTASATFTSASEASYCVVARLVAGSGGGANPWYTAGNAETAMIVFYEPSGQFATGGGWIEDPGGSKGNFGFTARYLKKGQIQGHMVYVYHGVYLGEQADFIIKSNALSGLAFGGASYPIPATLQGKCTLQINRSSDGSLLYSEGNASFQANVVDSGDGTGSGDTFAIVVYDRNGVIYKNVTTSPLGGGNVVIHQ
jgi:beta-galactosidase